MKDSSCLLVCVDFKGKEHSVYGDKIAEVLMHFFEEEGLSYTMEKQDLKTSGSYEFKEIYRLK